MEWLANFFVGIAVSIGSLFGVTSTQDVPPVPPEIQVEVETTSTPEPKTNAMVKAQTYLETPTSTQKTTPTSILDPLIAASIQNKKGDDIIPDCTHTPAACELNVSKEVALEKIAALRISKGEMKSESVVLRGGSPWVSPGECFGKGGELNQSGFFWTYWDIWGVTQVNATTGEAEFCQLEVSF
ncbi:MAG: hypothetical protein V4681_02490 [Patescibacteria group bacterium]